MITNLCENKTKPICCIKMGEGEREKGGEWEKVTDLQLKKITCLVRQLHHEDGLPNSRVYLPWAFGQSLC